MVIIGVDSHKRTHTVVAIDDTGRKLGERTAPATPDGHLELRAWAGRHPDRTWALEDCRHLSRRLEGDLLRAGERVIRVPPKLMAGARRAGREPGKSDPIDLRLLVDHRDDLVAERTRDMAHIARALVVRIRALTAEIDALEREIAGIVRSLAPSLLALRGCGPLSAAKLVGEAAGIARFRSRAAFARHNGSAPVPVWSGNDVRHRLSRGGNRQLNAALHRIAITQVRIGAEGRRYYDQRIAAGDTTTEAYRALRRRLSDEVYRRMRDDGGLQAVWRAPLDLAA